MYYLHIEIIKNVKKKKKTLRKRVVTRQKGCEDQSLCNQSPRK